ncbi:MAG TPA: farnesyl diphosphate synthase [Bacilli bacterium]
MAEPQTLAEFRKHYAERINRELAGCFPRDWGVPPRLHEAMQYSLMAGGKRLRPLLTLAAAEALGESAEAAIFPACAIEMIHTYSLIHDDLPAMDNDDYRRGKPTNHKVFGDAMAILAGDGLLTHAFFVAAQTSRHFPLPAERVLAILRELSVYAGAKGMVGGQALDMNGVQGVTTLEELELIHLRKTGDMIVCALKIGGHVAQASEREMAALERYGYDLGLAFQIQDDILDITGDFAKLGKSAKSDEKSGKVTYPYFLGLERSKRKVAELIERGKEAIRAAEFPKPGRLLEIADYVACRDR